MSFYCERCEQTFTNPLNAGRGHYCFTDEHIEAARAEAAAVQAAARQSIEALQSAPSADSPAVRIYGRSRQSDPSSGQSSSSGSSASSAATPAPAPQAVPPPVVVHPEGPHPQIFPFPVLPPQHAALPVTPLVPAKHLPPLPNRRS